MFSGGRPPRRRLHRLAGRLQLLVGAHDVASIAGEISRSFELPAQKVLAEVQATVAEFEALNLLQ